MDHLSTDFQHSHQELLDCLVGEVARPELIGSVEVNYPFAENSVYSSGGITCAMEFSCCKYSLAAWHMEDDLLHGNVRSSLAHSEDEASSCQSSQH